MPWPWTKQQTEDTGFWDWVKQRYPDSNEDKGLPFFSSIRDAWGDNYQASPYYQDYTQSTQPLTFQGSSKFGYPEISMTQYKNGIKKFYSMMVDRGMYTQDQAEDLANAAINQAETQGVTMNLPWYSAVSSQFMTPEWESEMESQFAKSSSEDALAREKLDLNWAELGQRRAEMQQKQMSAWNDIQTNQEQSRINYLYSPFSQERALQQQLDEQARQQQAQTFEQWRNNLLSELSGPQDWITRWELQNKPNPYTAKGKVDLQLAKLESLKAEQQRLQPFYDQVMKKLKSSNDNLTPAGVARPRSEDEQWAADILGDYAAVANDASKVEAELYRIENKPQSTSEQLEAMVVRAYQNAGMQAEQTEQEIAENPWAKPRKISEGMYAIGEPTEPEPVAPTAPPTPEWLPSFVPQLTAGQPISKQMVAPPSGQLWSNTPWSQQQGLMGYTEWSGQSFNDILSQMQMAQPRTPNVAYRWSPASQRR